MNNKTPNNWVKANLGDILKLKNGYAFKSKNYLEKGIPVIRISEIKNENTSLDKAKYVDESEFLENFIIKEGDILIAMSGATTGKYGIYDKKIKAYQNQRVGNLRPYSNKHINKKYVYYLIGELKKEIEEKAYGGAQPNISSKLIENTSFNLAPLKEQQRIVEKLDLLFSELDDVKLRLEKIPVLLKNFRQAVLSQAVTGKLTEEWREGMNLDEVSVLIKKIKDDLELNYQLKCKAAKESGNRKPKDQRKNKKSEKEDINLPTLPIGWLYERAEDVSYLITDGVHFKPTYIESGTPFLSVKNVRPFKISSGNYKYISKEHHLDYIKRCNPEKNDILYTKVGATYGYAAKVNLKFDFSIYVSLALIKPSKFLNSDYLEILFNSELIFAQARHRVSGSGVPDLHLIEIRDFKLPIPSLEEQIEIVKRVEKFLLNIDLIEKQYEALKQQIEVLPQSILHKAFKGELVEQLPTDGDARELLKQIKKLKEEINKKGKKRK